MDENERLNIVSEDFADILIEYNRNLTLLERYGDYAYNLINEKYAILHIPVTYMNENSIIEYGYAAIPKCYGLMTYLDTDPISEFTVRSFPEDYFTGKGVLVGVVDTGIDYTNSVFQYTDNTTKIVSLWDQTIFSDKYPEEFFYGTEYSREEINAALQAENPQQIVPSTDEIGEGTAMAGIATGLYAQEEGFSGVSTDAELVVVKVKPSKAYLKDFYGIPEDAVCYQQNDIMMGIQYLINVARRMDKPISICIGLGSSQGSHKGEDIMGNYLAENGNRPGIAIIVAAGNEGNQRHHYFGEIIPPILYEVAELNVGVEDKNFSMELWGHLPNVVTVSVISPSGFQVYEIKPDFVGQRHITIIYEDATIHIDSYISETYSEEQLILFRFKNIQSGIWKFQISGTEDLASRFHIWLPIYNFISEETYFLMSNPYTTISIPGNALNIITVTAYNPIDRTLAPSASKGFTSANLPKPDIAAPGVNLLVPTIIQTFITLSGTSLAAAYTAGVTAGLLEWGVVNENFPSMNSTIVRYFLANSAIRSRERIYPNPDWGYGLIE